MIKIILIMICVILLSGCIEVNINSEDDKMAKPVEIKQNNKTMLIIKDSGHIMSFSSEEEYRKWAGELSDVQKYCENSEWWETGVPDDKYEEYIDCVEKHSEKLEIKK